MNVGLLDTFGPRFLRFWEPYLRDLGVTLSRGTLPKREAYALGRESLPGEPPHVQLALGRILEFGRADLVVLPQTPGVEGDPWGEAFADVLARRVSSLPALAAVPFTGDGAAAVAAEIGTRLTRNPGLVRRALDRHRLLLTPPRESLPELRASGKRTVAVIGPEVALAEPFVLGTLPAALAAADLYPVYAPQVPRDLVADRGLRGGGGTPGERELVGALAALEGKSAVRGFLVAVPARSAALARFADGLVARARKPALRVDLDPDRDDWGEIARFAARLVPGVTTPGGDE